eukprot:TRINITY_DN9329_c0_g1_i4.p1 TRINITY_DN9329_c0_g1~~TRINITY_DN9329_c0_g1_i4.p1  ORF type:complete len:498 (-),score=70.72 TRINITY_DN9329_c0_g1_i4:117-1517(-)
MCIRDSEEDSISQVFKDIVNEIRHKQNYKEGGRRFGVFLKKIEKLLDDLEGEKVIILKDGSCNEIVYPYSKAARLFFGSMYVRVTRPTRLSLPAVRILELVNALSFDVCLLRQASEMMAESFANGTLENGWGFNTTREIFKNFFEKQKFNSTLKGWMSLESSIEKVLSNPDHIFKIPNTARFKVLAKTLRDIVASIDKMAWAQAGYLYGSFIELLKSESAPPHLVDTQIELIQGTNRSENSAFLSTRLFLLGLSLPFIKVKTTPEIFVLLDKINRDANAVKDMLRAAEIVLRGSDFREQTLANESFNMIQSLMANEVLSYLNFSSDANPELRDKNLQKYLHVMGEIFTDTKRFDEIMQPIIEKKPTLFPRLLGKIYGLFEQHLYCEAGYGVGQLIISLYESISRSQYSKLFNKKQSFSLCVSYVNVCNVEKIRCRLGGNPYFLWWLLDQSEIDVQIVILIVSESDS